MEPSPVLDDWIACPECDSRDIVIEYMRSGGDTDRYTRSWEAVANTK